MSNLKKKAVSLEEPKRFLKKHPEIKSFDIVMHDCNAVGRGKIIRRHELLKLFESGRQFPIFTWNGYHRRGCSGYRFNFRTGRW